MSSGAGAHGIAANHVWKKFRRGELHDSLRDLVPAVTRSLFGKGRNGGDGETRSAAEFWALRDLDFEVRPGEVLGIIGPNGAGKSTTLKLLNRILRPNRGTIEVRGRVGALIEIAAGFHPDLTGRENTYLQGSLVGMKRREVARHFDEIVHFAEVEDFIDTPVKRYSSGMNARLGFAIATSLEQEVLLIDEVLSVGDWTFQQKCHRRMRELVGSGAAVVFVSHNLRAVATLCDRAILLMRGETVADGRPEDVVRQYSAGVAERPRSAHRTPVTIRRVTVRGPDGERWAYRAGQEARVDVELQANDPVSAVGVGLYLTDEHSYKVFETSTERLGLAPVSLGRDTEWRCTLTLTLHLTAGEFQLGVVAEQYGLGEVTALDSWFPAATIRVSCDRDMSGTTNLYPHIVRAGSDEAAGPAP